MPQFDTGALTTAERVQQISRHLKESLGECRVTHLCDEAAVWGRWRSVRLSSTTWVCRYDGSAVRVTRRAVDIAADPTTWLTFAVPGLGGSTLWQHGWLRQVLAGELVLFDVGSPYDFRGAGGACCVVQAQPVDLGVSAAQARAAAPYLRQSPLHDLASEHVRELADVVCPTPPDPAATRAVATATTRLLGALVISCAPATSSGGPA